MLWLATYYWTWYFVFAVLIREFVDLSIPVGQRWVSSLSSQDAEPEKMQL